MYERVVNPWVDQYESSVDDAVDEAHRGLRRWIWTRLGGMTWILVGEGGSLVMGIVNVAITALYGRDSTKIQVSTRHSTIQPSGSSKQLDQRHSVKEALRATSSIDDFGSHSFIPTNEFVNDFMSMLQRGLYVFANVNNNAEVNHIGSNDAMKHQHNLEGEYKLSLFSYTGDENGAIVISQLPTESHELGPDKPVSVRLPLDSLMPLRPTSSRGLVLECQYTIERSKSNILTHTTTVEIILSDESDREILMSGLNSCLSCIHPHQKNE